MSRDDVLLDVGLFERDLTVQAGAGTGKTHALVTLYLHWIAGLTAARTPVAPDEIAVITFTDKAAAELKTRIRLRLVAALANVHAERTLVAAAEHLGVPLPATSVFADALERLGRAPIGTFHGVCGALLRRFALEAGVDPEARQIEEVAAEQLASEIAEREILAALAEDLPGAEDLVLQYGFRGSQIYQRLVEYLVALRARLAEEGRDAATLPVDDPERLASEEKRAIADWRSGIEQLRGHRDELGDKARDAADRLLALPMDEALEQGERFIKKLAGGPKGMAAALKETLRGPLERLEMLKASVQALPMQAALVSLLQRLERRYAAEKRRRGVLDFADLLVLARDLLRRNSAVQQATSARFRAVLVDEFQDTNTVQSEIVRLLTGELGAARLFVVGDRKQSIYEFRGADVAVFTRLSRELVERGGKKCVLGVSRRSTPELIRFANALFSRAMRRASDADWDLSFDEHDDALEPLPGRAAGPRPQLLDVAPQRDAPTTRRSEAAAIAARIAGLHAMGRPLNDMVILLRRFTALSTYLDALRARGVPYYVVRGRGFFDTEEVQDLAAAFTVLDDPDDELALVTLLRSPLVALSDETLAKLAIADELSTTKVLGASYQPPSMSEDERARFDRFRALFRTLRLDADRLAAARTAERIVEGLGLDAIFAGLDDGAQRIANLQRLVRHLARLESTGRDFRAAVRWLKRATSVPRCVG